MEPAYTPEHFRHYLTLDIRYGDLDTLGHVNNSKYLTYIEQARISYMRDLGLWHGYVSNVGMIVARIAMDYKLPLRTEDSPVIVWTRVSRLGSKSFTLLNEVIRQKDSALAAASETVMVTFDYEKDETILIPDHWRRAIETYEPGL